MSKERLQELIFLPRELTPEEKLELSNLRNSLTNQDEEETAGFFEAIKKTSQNLFSSASAGIEAIGQASGDLDIFDFEGKGRRGQELVAPALSSGRRLKTFDDISDVGDAAEGGCGCIECCECCCECCECCFDWITCGCCDSDDD